MLNLPIDIVCEPFLCMCCCCFTMWLWSMGLWGPERCWNIPPKIFTHNLKTFKYTPNAMLSRETGSMDMTTKVHKRTINFWLKLKFSPLEKFLSSICQLMSKQCSDNPESNHFKWCQKIKTSLDEAGFSSTWDAQEMKMDYFKVFFSQWCDDIFLQKARKCRKTVNARIILCLNRISKYRNTCYL